MTETCMACGKVIRDDQMGIRAPVPHYQWVEGGSTHTLCACHIAKVSWAALRRSSEREMPTDSSRFTAPLPAEYRPALPVVARANPRIVQCVRYIERRRPSILRWIAYCGGLATVITKSRDVQAIRIIFDGWRAEGFVDALPGSWIVRGVKGEFYCVEDSLFSALYDPASQLDLPSVADVSYLLSSERKNGVSTPDPHLGDDPLHFVEPRD